MSGSYEQDVCCITCGDKGVWMRVVSVTAGEVVCVDEDSARHECVAVDLVEPVASGDRVLVHARVAIAGEFRDPLRRIC